MEPPAVGYVLILWFLSLRHASYQVHDTVLNEHQLAGQPSLTVDSYQVNETVLLGQLFAGQPSFSVDASWPLRPSRPTMESPEVGYILTWWTLNFRRPLPGASDNNY